MDAKNIPTHLLQISSKYSADTTWNMADYAGNITAQVRRAFEPENMSRTWTIEHWQLVMASMLTAVTGTKVDTAKTFQVNTTVSPDVTVAPEKKTRIFRVYPTNVTRDWLDILYKCISAPEATGGCLAHESNTRTFSVHLDGNTLPRYISNGSVW